MLRYYINTGGPGGVEMFVPYIWGEEGFGKLIKQELINKNYGDDLKLLLIMFYVESQISTYLPEIPKLGNYSSKNKDIKVEFGVPDKLFRDRNEFERREFIVDSSIRAIKLVQAKLEKKKLDVDFDELLKDINKLAQQFLIKEGAYSKF